MTGNFYTDDGGIYGIYKKVSEGRIKSDRSLIDLIIWLDESKEPYFLFGDSKTEKLSVLFNIKDEDITKRY